MKGHNIYLCPKVQKLENKCASLFETLNEKQAAEVQEITNEAFGDIYIDNGQIPTDWLDPNDNKNLEKEVLVNYKKSIMMDHDNGIEDKKDINYPKAKAQRLKEKRVKHKSKPQITLCSLSINLLLLLCMLVVIRSVNEYKLLVNNQQTAEIILVDEMSKLGNSKRIRAEKDQNNAFSHPQKSAENGYYSEQCNVVYYSGIGPEEDEYKVSTYFQKSANMDNETALSNVVRLYQNSISTKREFGRQIIGLKNIEAFEN
ncbi:putative Non-specific protein-tyrosine kinase [Gigaspora margarita]|uniref:Putative Non-specific protein-tyrosine kinase n=1 Tax=Gigaspora margarita TaxID=4874 RepID=A0A8H4A5R9_GIGMA|nr:putative Non-specific protein-tyrosine kinase [Gigaspora margarita]